MIYVRRDPALIPEKVLRVAERAQVHLEGLPQDQRAEFIEKKKRVWRAFARYLAKMSYGKCWYSESDCVQSFMDVDHFRPKKQAKRTVAESDDGYPWLAFSWDNFRLSAQRSNQINVEDEAEGSVGKGAWFPLMQGGKRATWDDRSVDDERPLLLDPARLEDVRLIEVKPTGLMGPSRFCLGEYHRDRVERSIRLLGLNLPGLVGARKERMRLIERLYTKVERMKVAAEKSAAASALIATKLPIDSQLEELQLLSHPRYPYAAAARAQLREMGLGDLCLQAELPQFAV